MLDLAPDARRVGHGRHGIATSGTHRWRATAGHGLARWRIGFRWSAEVTRQAVVLGFAAVLVHVAARWSEPFAAGVGLMAAFGFGVYGLGRLGAMADLTGPLGRLAGWSRRITRGWLT